MMDEPVLFRTERLIIRRFRQEDVGDIVAFASHPSVYAELPKIPVADNVKLAEYIETQRELALFSAGKCVDLAVEMKDGGRVIGLLSFVADGERQGEIGWALGVEHRGQGYATEAARGLVTHLFATHHYHRIFAGTIFTNVRSWKLMERLGMRREAVFREAHVPVEPGGPWIDTVRYAVLASEWPTTR